MESNISIWVSKFNYRRPLEIFVLRLWRPSALNQIRTLLADLLVDVEVKSELGVVLLDNDASGLLDRLGSNAAL